MREREPCQNDPDVLLKKAGNVFVEVLIISLMRVPCEAIASTSTKPSSLICEFRTCLHEVTMHERERWGPKMVASLRSGSKTSSRL